MNSQANRRVDEVDVVLFANAIIEPLTMVIKLMAASVTCFAMLSVFLDHHIADVTLELKH